MKITFVYSCIPVRGHSITTWTDFCPFLTTHLPLVDKRGHLADHLPYVHVDIQKLTTSLSPHPKLIIYCYFNWWKYCNFDSWKTKNVTFLTWFEKYVD